MLGLSKALDASLGLRSEFKATIAHEAAGFSDASRKVIAMVDRELKELTLTPKDRAILELAGKARDLAQLDKQLTDQARTTEAARRSRRDAEQVVGTFAAAKRARIKSIYDAIQDDVSKYYEALHPGAHHKDLRLILSEARRASTELRMTAFGRSDEDPRAYSSEGQLDSLGLCIFLAFVKNFTSACPLIILDDVVMSVDAAHRALVAELLLTEFSDYQLLITTHDEIWLEELQRYQRARSADGRFLNLRIVRWSLNEGPVAVPFKPRWERIEARLNDADKIGAANEGRQYLEWALKEICFGAEAPVVLRRDGRYTPADLETPAKSRLGKLLPAEVATIDSLFTGIATTAAPGNLLSHDNENALAMEIDEIRRFCEAVHSLAQWYQCPSCGSVLVYAREFRQLRCANSRCRDPKIWKTV